MIEVSQLLACTGASLIRSGAESFTGATINSKEVSPGDLFFAIRGTRDGHDFVLDAVRAGASGLVVEQDVPDISDSVAVIKVPDTLTALQELGSAARARSDARVIAVTGSAGKTTTKSMVAHLLGAHLNVLSSAKSFNNHLGVPLSLLRLTSEHSHAVAEVGTNHRGEIGNLAMLVKPDIALVTNVGFAHVGNFDSREDLADEKSDLLRNVNPGGFWLLNGDDELLNEAARRQPVPDGVTVVRVGFGPENDIRAVDTRFTEDGTSGSILTQDGSTPFRLPLPGRHFVYAALFSLAVGRLCGISVSSGVKSLEEFSTPQGRASMKQVTEELSVLDDSYNASPDATLAALDLLGEMSAGTRIAVLGEMRELGAWSDELHKLVGRKAASAATHLIAVGEEGKKLLEAAADQGFPSAAMWLATSARDAQTTTQDIVSGTAGRCVVLAKGARFMHMERVPLGLSGTHVGCSLSVCTKYIHCQDCPQLKGE
ncbi:UDP-N-acetylmuramoyl-tripeptide--D-alanyl-D-alanine ligase [Streptomyces sp. NBC_01017]|uniref:UDP-N-acetylmuramoyl-tripeptide--D-alanyl-D- alanine ligase n=1 Tax=Streptomyces sp. NBC_01017 TaxID=2903721 RepID=UPI00386FFF90|nr:UDP-N-acetylmuramoyl-tripeptide--D-alanyl-D-alanine ligase [Streptomyces sp. NBC_01017]